MESCIEQILVLVATIQTRIRAGHYLVHVIGALKTVVEKVSLQMENKQGSVGPNLGEKSQCNTREREAG